jgi:antirestriction protein ArdC
MRPASNRRADRPGRKDRNDSSPGGSTLYDDVTARVIGELEAERFPWVQPWGLPGAQNSAALGLPYNAATARSYSGINILILWGALFDNAYPAQGWLTFRQALNAGGQVRKGEHGTTVVYADRFVPEAEKARARDAGDEARGIPFLKRFTVFNLAQCEGLEIAPGDVPSVLPARELSPLGEAIIAASGVDFRIGGSKAFYAPEPDFIQVPPQTAFFDQINYYRTALHELTDFALPRFKVGEALAFTHLGHVRFLFRKSARRHLSLLARPIAATPKGNVSQRPRPCPDVAAQRPESLRARDARRGVL